MGHKILFISDIHFGIKGNSETFLEIIENFFLKTLAKVIKDKNITDVRILGDLFDNRNTINIRTVNTVMKIFRWYQFNMPSVKWKILLGNHDIYYHNRLDINSIEILREFSSIEVIDTMKEETIDGKSIIMFPWLVKDSEPEIKFKEVCNSDKKYDLCLGHFEINGFEVTHDIFYEEGVDTGVFKNFKRVFSGHFHLRRSQNHISYLGCPYQLNWGDFGDEKGIHIYDIDTKEVEFIVNEDSPVFVRININDLLSKNIDKLKMVKNNFVKLVIDQKYTDQIIVKAIEKMESMMPKRLDVENNYIEIFEGETGQEETLDLNKLNDPLSFLSEYIKNIEIDSEIDKKAFSDYISVMYSNITKDGD